MRRTLYCVEERSSALSTPNAPRVSRSAVRSKSRKAVSSALPARRTLLDRVTAFTVFVITTIVKTYVSDAHSPRFLFRDWMACPNPGSMKKSAWSGTSLLIGWSATRMPNGTMSQQTLNPGPDSRAWAYLPVPATSNSSKETYRCHTGWNKCEANELNKYERPGNKQR